MGIDYALRYDCEAKRALTLEGMIARIKGRNHALLMIEEERRTNPTKDLSEITFKRIVMTPQGNVQEDCSAADLLEAACILDKFESQCVGCPANFLNEPFGCNGYIKYPIRRATEKWLMRLLPEDLKSTAGEYLLKGILDFRLGGKPIEAMRRGRGIFFEAKSPEKRRWGTFFNGEMISSSQLLEAIFFRGEIEPPHAIFLCLFLGVLPHDIALGSLSEILDNPASVKAQATAPCQPPPEAGADLARFICALITAIELNVAVYLDA